MIAKFEIKERKVELTGSELNLFGNMAEVEVNEYLECVNVFINNGRAFLNLEMNDFDRWLDNRQNDLEFLNDGDCEESEIEEDLKSWFEYM